MTDYNLQAGACETPDSCTYRKRMDINNVDTSTVVSVVSSIINALGLQPMMEGDRFSFKLQEQGKRSLMALMVSTSYKWTPKEVAGRTGIHLKENGYPTTFDNLGISKLGHIFENVAIYRCPASRIKVL